MPDDVIRRGDWPEAADEERQAEEATIQAIDAVCFIARYVPPDKRDRLWSAVQQLNTAQAAWLAARQHADEVFDALTTEGFHPYLVATEAVSAAEAEVVALTHEAARLAQYVPSAHRDVLWNTVRMAHTRLLEWERLHRRTLAAIDMWLGEEEA
jgi:hypothetical protein